MMHMHTSMPRPTQSIRKTLIADARAAVDACAGWNARLAARRITGFLNRRMQGSGLSLAQFGLMAQIASAHDDTLAALAQRTGLDQSTLSRNLHGLETGGLVEIAIAADDQRRRAVWLTEEGARQLETALPFMEEAQAALAERLNPDLALKLGAATEALTRK
jgi:DNA-binding MarR family transcriptional regulator